MRVNPQPKTISIGTDIDFPPGNGPVPRGRHPACTAAVEADSRGRSNWNVTEPAIRFSTKGRLQPWEF